MRIAETFISRQGEGKLTGTETFFIRTSGCNLRCWFCDTPYASWKPVGENMSIDQVVHLAMKSRLEHVVLTGGEPLLSPHAPGLTRALRDKGFHVTIETAGTLDSDVECDLMSISPKLSTSAPSAVEFPRWNVLHEQRRIRIEAMRSLVKKSLDFQFKFVVDQQGDFDEIKQLFDALPIDKADVWIMPQGSTLEAMDAAAEWLKPITESYGYHYCDRMQIRWFGNRRGT